jgi:hypothetical protein
VTPGIYQTHPSLSGMAQMIIAAEQYYLVPLKDPGSVEDFANWIYTTEIIPSQILRKSDLNLSR